MGFFARLAQIIRSNVNALLGAAEDPEKMLRQAVVEMGEQLDTAKRQVAGAIYTPSGGLGVHRPGPFH